MCESPIQYPERTVYKGKKDLILTRLMQLMDLKCSNNSHPVVYFFRTENLFY